MGLFDRQKEKDNKARALRDAEMKRRQERGDQEEAERLKPILKEIARIAEQTKARKEGRLKP